MGTSCCANVGTRKAAASTAAVKSCHNVVQVACRFTTAKMQGSWPTHHGCRGRTLESLHNVKKLSLIFAKVLRLFSLTAFSALAAISRWRHLRKQCRRQHQSLLSEHVVRKKQQESSSKDDGLHKERSEANCCSRDRCSVGAGAKYSTRCAGAA